MTVSAAFSGLEVIVFNCIELLVAYIRAAVEWYRVVGAAVVSVARLPMPAWENCEHSEYLHSTTDMRLAAPSHVVDTSDVLVRVGYYRSKECVPSSSWINDNLPHVRWIHRDSHAAPRVPWLGDAE